MNLKEIRKRNSLTQKEVAKYLNIANSTYNGYEKETSEPNIQNLMKLAELFDCTIDELIGNKKSTSLTASPEKQNLLSTIDKLTEIECHKLNIFAEGLISNRVEQQKKRTDNLINIINKDN